MIQFEYLQLKKRPQFADQTFDLSQPGISLILGHNKKTGSHNGVGKSYFFGELADFLTEDESMGTRQDKVRKGGVKFGVKVGKTRYEFERTFSPREVITVFKNGEDMGFRELKEARAFMNKIVPYSEQAVGSFLYMDLANGSHPLVTGTSATRKAFFRDFFPQIDALAGVRSLVDVEADRLSSDTDSLSSVQAEIAALGERRKLVALKKEVAALSEKRDAFSHDLDQLAAARHLKQQLAEYDADKLEEFSEVNPEELKARRKDFRRAQSQIDAFAEWLSENAGVEDERRSLKAKVAELDPLEDLRATHKTISEEVKALTRQVDEFSDRRQELTELLSKAQERKRRKIQERRELKKQSGQCPTCGGEYHDEHLEKSIQELRDTIDDLDGKILGYSKELESFRESDALTLGVKLNTRRARVEKLQEQIDLHDEYAQVLRRIRTRPDEPKVTQKQLDKAIARAEVEQEGYEQYSKWYELNQEWRALPKEIRSRCSDEGLHAEFVALNDQLNEKRMQLEEGIRVNTEIDTLSKREQELQERLKLKPYLDILKSAFSRRDANKGVEKEMISMACSMLADQVNRFAKYVFNEDFTFSFELGSNFSILVHRNYGKHVAVSDIRRLSGAEKRLFSLVLVVALLAFIPPSKRPNILVLDEPTATMGEDNKAGFVRFLPILNKVVPHLVVITPLEPHDYAHLNPRVFTVVKDGSRSTIQRGLYDSTNRRLSKRSVE